MSTRISSVIPTYAVVPATKSTSKHIMDRRSLEIVPTSQTSFSYNTNSRVQFDISSPASFWDLQSSYIRFKLTCALTNNGVNDVNKYLSEGGAHSLFRSIEVSTQNGTLIQRIDRYSKFASIMNNLCYSADHVDTMLAREGDSMSYRDFEPEVSGGDSVRDFSYTLASVEYDHTGGAAEQLLVLGAAGRATSELKVGDVLRIETAVLNYTARVLTIISDTSITIEGLPAVDIAAAAVLSLKLLRGKQVEPVRKRVANNVSVLTFQPMVPFLQLGNWIPLMLIRGGLRITLELERPEFCLATTSTPTGTGFAGANVIIDNPTYVCDFINPDEQLAKSYLDMHRSGGVPYMFTGIRHWLDTCTGVGPKSTNLNANVRSARWILSVIQNQRHETITSATANLGKSTYSTDACGNFLKAGLKEYEYVSGSERFPLNKPLDVTNYTNAEVFTELLKVVDRNAPIWESRIQPWEFQSVLHNIHPEQQGRVIGSGDSHKFIYGASLVRDNGSVFTGLDLSLQGITANLDFDTDHEVSDYLTGSNNVQATRYLHHYMGYDAIVIFSEDGILVKS